MLVTLDREDWPPPKRLRFSQGNWNATLASHNPIACLVGKPCIHIYGLTKRQKNLIKRRGCALYPIVHQRNILTVLNHESLHCAFQNLFGFDDADEFDTLDKIISNVAGTKKFLEAA